MIGVPDPQWGQQPFAYCVLKDGEAARPEEIVEHCHGHLAGFKRPRGVIFLDELPRTATGKILRRELRARQAEAADAPCP